MPGIMHHGDALGRFLPERNYCLVTKFALSNNVLYGLLARDINTGSPNLVIMID